MVGALFGGLFILNNLYRTVRRQRQVRWSELLIAFMTVLLPIAGLLVDNARSARFDLLEQLLFLLIIPIFLTSLALSIIEGFRPQRWKQSRGLFGMGMAVLLLLANLSYNFISLNAELSSIEVNVRPTPVNAVAGVNLCEQTGLQVANTLLQFISSATGKTPEALRDDVLLGSGEQSLAQLVSANGQNPNDLINAMVSYLDPSIQELVAQGCIPAGQGTFILSQLRTFIAFAVNSDINTIQQFIGGFGGGGDAGGNQDLSAEDLQATRVALVQNAPTGTPLPSLTPSPTATLSPTPTATRTPFPTLSPTPTRERFVTPSPTATPTLPNPCLATSLFNVNLRSAPDANTSQVVAVIPFDSTVTLYAPNPERTWWFGQYEGQEGWLNGEFIRVTRACDALPPRTP